MGAGNGCLVFIQGFLHIFQTKAMVALILFAGLEKVSLLWRRGIGDAAQDGGGILLQNELDPFSASAGRRSQASMALSRALPKMMEQSSGAMGRFSWIFIFV